MDEARVFSVVHSDRTRINVLKLAHRQFHNNMRMNFFTVREMEVEHIAQRGSGVSFCANIQDPYGCLSVQPTAGYPL